MPGAGRRAGGVGRPDPAARASSRPPRSAGLNEPMDVEIAPDGRVFVAEKSGIIRTYDSLSDTTAHTFADLRTQVHNFSNRGLLGARGRPRLPGPALRLRLLHARRPDRRHPAHAGATPARRRTDPAPRRGRLPRARVRVSKLRVDGERRRRAPSRCWSTTGASSSSSTPAAASSSAPTATSTCRAATARAGGSGTTASSATRRTRAATRPATGRVGPMPPPTAEGGRLRAQDLRTSGDPLGLAGSLIRIDPDTGAGVPGNPMFSSARPQRAPHARARLPQPGRGSRSGPARTTSGWPTAAAATGRSSTACPTRPTRCATSAGPATRAASTRTAYPTRASGRAATTRTSTSARTSTRRCTRHVGAVLGLRPRASRSCPARTARINPEHRRAGRQPDLGASPSIPAAGSFPAAYRRRAVLRRPAAQLHLGDAARARRAPGARAGGPVRAADASEPFDIEVAPGGDLLYVDQDADAVQRVSVRRAARQPGADRRRAGRRDDREPAPDGRLRRRGVERPRRRRRDRVRVGPRRRRRVRRLDRPPAPCSPTCRAAPSPSRCG